jgi:hypothetical protein
MVDDICFPAPIRAKLYANVPGNLAKGYALFEMRLEVLKTIVPSGPTNRLDDRAGARRFRWAERDRFRVQMKSDF